MLAGMASAGESARGDGPPLADLLVLDLSRVLTGPYAAMMLGDLGARVIKVERPEGDDTRQWGPPFVGPEDAREATYFLSTNRTRVGGARLQGSRWAAHARAARGGRRRAGGENFRPGVLDRLGVGHERRLELNPRLVILSITGPDGPESGRAGYDQILQRERAPSRARALAAARGA